MTTEKKIENTLCPRCYFDPCHKRSDLYFDQSTSLYKCVSFFKKPLLRQRLGPPGPHSSRIVSIRIKKDLYNLLEIYCSERNFSPTAFIKQIVLKELHYYLGGDIKNE